LGVGWGTGSIISSVSGFDQAFQVKVSTGTGPSSTGATILLTYADGSWGTPPQPICKMEGGTGALANTTETSTATALTLTYLATPVSGKNYTFQCTLLGN